MARPRPLSGFPEFSPAQRIVELAVLDSLRRTFELHGFASIETRAVEPVSELLRKGETSKEIYLLRRLQDADAARPAELGLHFDLTVPLARYVLERSGELDFPFKRYQIQKVWRGERPQDGRFREFVQADIDIVGDGELPFHHEVSLPLVMAKALGALPIGPVRIDVSNRKVAEGFCRGIGVEDTAPVLAGIDKLAKIGPDAVGELLAAAGLDSRQAAACLKLATISGGPEAIERASALVSSLGAANPLLEEGLDELNQLVTHGAEHAGGIVQVNLAIVRGLDYYTGSVYETVLVGEESLGSICSGGRYDALASDGKRTFPGVGLSIGVTRLLSRLLASGRATASRSVPTAVLVAVNDEGHRWASEAVATTLRARDIPADTAPSAAKFGRQIRHAERRGIPYVWFIGDDGAHSVKDIRTGEQFAVDLDGWAPPAVDLAPRLVIQGQDGGHGDAVDAGH